MPHNIGAVPFGALTQGHLIVVASGVEALILENEGSLARPELRVIDRITVPCAGGIKPNLPSPNPSGEVSDRNRLAEIALAAMIMARLAKEAMRGRLIRLSLVAPDHVIAALRDRMDPGLLARLVLTLPELMIGQPIETISARLQAALRQAA